MNANELRIGNLLGDREGRICRVESIDKEIRECRIQAINYAITSMPVSPIPLTPEWLEKLGFNGHDTHGVPQRDKVHVNQQLGQYYVWLHTGRFAKTLIEVEMRYVHQLQNLFFALSGKELEVRS